MVEVVNKTVRLHPTQAAFKRSDAPYRAFCGGIGCGKSWVGAYDLVCRAKARRLYMACAPTYPMLLDSTLRSFLDVADQLGVVDFADVKRSAPPEVRLRTGAEVLFRSADDPDRMRGPNLSGLWLDEASLMKEEAYQVGIGRLREGGEQGWLSATFTPKGKRHWTYRVFGAGGGNTQLFRARTADNPFLPAEFEGNVRGQYPSSLASQELGGEFIDLAGAIFRREWFPFLEWPPVGLLKVRYWDLAATAPKDGADPDWTAGVLMGKDAAGCYHVLDVRRVRASPSGVEDLIKQTAELDGHNVPVRMEQEPGSSGVGMIDHYLRRVLAGWDFAGVKTTGDKVTRAMPLAAMAEPGNVRLVRGPWNKDFLDEVEGFPGGEHDDQVDAAAGAFHYLAGLPVAFELGYATGDQLSPFLNAPKGVF